MGNYSAAAPMLWAVVCSVGRIRAFDCMDRDASEGGAPVNYSGDAIGAE